MWAIGRVPPIKQLFPTEKPPALLERIITASSAEGDVRGRLVSERPRSRGTPADPRDVFSLAGFGVVVSARSCASAAANNGASARGRIGFHQQARRRAAGVLRPRPNPLGGLPGTSRTRSPGLGRRPGDLATRHLLCRRSRRETSTSAFVTGGEKQEPCPSRSAPSRPPCTRLLTAGQSSSENDKKSSGDGDTCCPVRPVR